MSKRAETLSQLAQRNFEGTDADLETSLFEYGLAWKVYKRDAGSFKAGEIMFYYICSYDADDLPLFGWSTLHSSVDIYSEYDWADFDAFFAYLGMEKGDWDELPTPHRISDLIRYYGVENIFGTEYNPFRIGTVENPVSAA